MKTRISAGGIVFNQEGRVLVTLSSGGPYWELPKGLLKEGEDIHKGALREVREEGGVEAKIVIEIGENMFIDEDKKTGEKTQRRVIFFLMDYISGDPKDHDWEVEEAGWYEPEEALKILTWPKQREFLKKALEIRNKSSR